MKKLHAYFSKEIGWVTAYTAFVLIVYYVIRVVIFPENIPDNRDMRAVHIIYFLNVAFVFLVWICVHHLQKLPLLIVFFLGPLICIVTDMAHTETATFIIYHKFSWQFEIGTTFSAILRNAYTGSMFYLTWYLGYFGIIYHFRFVREAVAASKARAQAHAAQLQMLRYQLNPHFIFNTLNSISALVLDKKNRPAEKMIGNLSRFLRFTLDKPPNIKITLEEELAIIKEYLEIEETRFADRLNTQFQIDPESLQCLVPSLILQPAIENAIKHAIAPKKTGGTILVSTNIKAKKLHISITDNGPGLPPEFKNAGVGVENMRARLRVMYAENGTLDLTKNKHGGVSVNISLPVEYHKTTEARQQ